MSNYEHNRYLVSDRRRRTWGWLAAVLGVILVVVGVLFATGQWGENTTRTGGAADTAQLPPAAGQSQPGVPNIKTR